jgi:hypothetical protein
MSAKIIQFVPKPRSGRILGTVVCYGRPADVVGSQEVNLDEKTPYGGAGIDGIPYQAKDQDPA